MALIQIMINIAYRFFLIFEKFRKSYKNMKMKTLENMLFTKRCKELNNVNLLKSILKDASTVVSGSTQRKYWELSCCVI